MFCLRARSTIPPTRFIREGSNASRNGAVRGACSRPARSATSTSCPRGTRLVRDICCARDVSSSWTDSFCFARSRRQPAFSPQRTRPAARNTAAIRVFSRLRWRSSSGCASAPSRKLQAGVWLSRTLPAMPRARNRAGSRADRNVMSPNDSNPASRARVNVFEIAGPVQTHCAAGAPCSGIWERSNCWALWMKRRAGSESAASSAAAPARMLCVLRNSVPRPNTRVLWSAPTYAMTRKASRSAGISRRPCAQRASASWSRRIGSMPARRRSSSRAAMSLVRAATASTSIRPSPDSRN